MPILPLPLPTPLSILRYRFQFQPQPRIYQAIIRNSFFSTLAAHLRAKALPPRRVLDEHELEEKFIRGSGPGGQKINKSSCAVHLRHTPSGLSIKTQESRSQAQNRKLARRLLADKLEEMEKGRESRLGMKAETKRKRKASGKKKARRKYRRLEEEKEEDVEVEAEAGGIGDGNEIRNGEVGDGEDAKNDNATTARGKSGSKR